MNKMFSPTTVVPKRDGRTISRLAFAFVVAAAIIGLQALLVPTGHNWIASFKDGTTDSDFDIYNFEVGTALVVHPNKEMCEDLSLIWARALNVWKRRGSPPDFQRYAGNIERFRVKFGSECPDQVFS